MSYFTTGRLALAIKTEALYQLWLVETGQQAWWPTASKDHFMAHMAVEWSHQLSEWRPVVKYGRLVGRGIGKRFKAEVL